MINQVSLLNAWPYLIIMIWFLYLEKKCLITRNSPKYGDYCFTIIYLFSILRYNIGADYPAYWNFVVEQSRDNSEFLSQQIFNVAYSLRFPPVLFFLFSTISLFSYRFFINRFSHNSVTSWYLYFCYPMFFFQDISTIRQGAAMGMVLIGATLCIDKKYLKALLFLFLAPLFHNSAWIGFLVLLAPLLNKLNLFHNVLIFSVSFILGNFVVTAFLSLFNGYYIASKFIQYIDYDFAKTNTLQYLIYFLVILNLLFYKKLINKNENNVIFVAFVTIGAALFNVFQIESQTARRISTFFLMFDLALIPDICNIIKEKTKMNGIKLCMIFLFILQIYYINLYIEGYNSKQISSPCFVPYDFWWNYL